MVIKIFLYMSLQSVRAKCKVALSTEYLSSLLAPLGVPHRALAPDIKGCENFNGRLCWSRPTGVAEPGRLVTMRIMRKALAFCMV